VTNISYSTKKHQKDAISVDLRVKEMMKKGIESPILYYKQQGNNVIVFHASLKMIFVL